MRLKYVSTLKKLMDKLLKIKKEVIKKAVKNDEERNHNNLVKKK